MKVCDLPEEVKETVLDRERGINVEHIEWWDDLLDEFKEIGKLLGIDIKNVYFELHCQGAGACFVGEYEYRKQSRSLIFGFAPKDQELNRIARELQELQRRYFYQLSARVTKINHHYNHETTVHVDVDVNRDFCEDLPEIAEEGITELLRDFMKWMYGQLDGTYQYLTSDFGVEETLMANEYEYDAEGNEL